MKYFLDTEFIEGTQKKRTFFNSREETKPTIDLISIGIVSENNREYYAISKDFNLKEAWNRWQVSDEEQDKANRLGVLPVKTYWLRKNVLKPIFMELLNKEVEFKFESLFYEKVENSDIFTNDTDTVAFTYKELKRLINKYGKSNKIIAEEVIDFTYVKETNTPGYVIDYNVEFYTYYGAYDWVVFCWLFGKMIDLPNGFPMFSIDLKVMLDNKVKTYVGKSLTKFRRPTGNTKHDNFKRCLNAIKSNSSYPTQDHLHNALDDAKWNKKLFNFIKTL